MLIKPFNLCHQRADTCPADLQFSVLDLLHYPTWFWINGDDQLCYWKNFGRWM